jgi:copper homeostasis protein (lipoprotein)
MAALLLAGCRNGKDGTTAAQTASQGSQPSGTRGFRGMYSYMADAGLFVDCTTGERFPVAAEEDNAALERAYLNERAEPGTPLLVIVEGRLEPRPRVDGPGTQTALIVERFVSVSPRKGCGDMDTITLEDTHWVMLELKGKPAVAPKAGKAPSLELNSKKRSAYGFGGCNRFFGSYESAGQALRLGALGSTRMACPEGMDQEQELFRVLGTVSRYEIQGARLLLFAGDELVAQFEARPPAQ